MKPYRQFVGLIALIGPIIGFAQPLRPAMVDSLPTQTLESIEVRASRALQVHSLPSVQGTYLLAGKRSALIRLTDLDANVTEKKRPADAGPDSGPVCL